MSAALKASCPICYGKGKWGKDDEYPCSTCADPAPALVRKVLTLLTVEHIAFLRQFEHTHANQPVTEEEYDQFAYQLSVDDDDAEVGDDYEIVIPATRHWLAGGQMHAGPGIDGWRRWIRYSPLGLALRECIMAGADARCRA